MNTYLFSVNLGLIVLWILMYLWERWDEHLEKRYDNYTWYKVCHAVSPSKEEINAWFHYQMPLRKKSYSTLGLQDVVDRAYNKLMRNPYNNYYRTKYIVKIIVSEDISVEFWLSNGTENRRPYNVKIKNEEFEDNELKQFGITLTEYQQEQLEDWRLGRKLCSVNEDVKRVATSNIQQRIKATEGLVIPQYQRPRINLI